MQLRDLRRVGIKLKYVLVPRQGQDETLRELKNCTPCEKCNEALAADSCGCFCVADCRGLVGAANALLAPVNVSPGMCHFGYGGKRSRSSCSTLSISAPEGQASLVFAAVFVVVWCGAAVVTANAQLLGGNV